MSYTTNNFKTKKQLKEFVKGNCEVRCHNPGLGPDLSNFTGRVCLEGPHYPAAHSWYAKAELVDGRVVKVK